MFEITSVILGILIGIIIMLVVVWICYLARIWFFAYCPVNWPVCGSGDYYNDPTEAIAAGASVPNILSIDSENRMFYKRVPKSSTCTPGNNQVVQIQNPQYCLFTFPEGQYDGKNAQFESNSYTSVVNGFVTFVDTTGNCAPVIGSAASAGIPLLKWD